VAPPHGSKGLRPGFGPNLKKRFDATVIAVLRSNVKPTAGVGPIWVAGMIRRAIHQRLRSSAARSVRAQPQEGHRQTLGSRCQCRLVAGGLNGGCACVSELVLAARRARHVHDPWIVFGLIAGVHSGQDCQQEGRGFFPGHGPRNCGSRGRRGSLYCAGRAVERATSALGSAVDGAVIIIIATGGNTQTMVARSLAPLLQDGQMILLIQGNTGGSLIVRRALDDAGCRAEVDVAETDNYPYSCRRLSATRIRPIVRKRWLQIAGSRIGEVFPRLSPLFPAAVPAPNFLYTGFTNANAMLHVANALPTLGLSRAGIVTNSMPKA
jgi:hypothetical protein